MRRIVFIGDGLGIAKCAARTKRLLRNAEINVVMSLAQEKDSEAINEDEVSPFAGHAIMHRASEDLLKSRTIGVLVSEEIDIDFEAREVRVSSARGWLPIRFDELVIECDARPRLPRKLQAAANLVPWPVSNTHAVDNLLDEADPTTVCVVGSTPEALEAVSLLLESGYRVNWLRCASEAAPALDNFVWHEVLRRIEGAAEEQLNVLDWNECHVESLQAEFDENGKLLALQNAEGVRVESDFFFWAEPQRFVHPILRNDGIDLAEDGLLAVDGHCMTGIDGVYALGTGISLPKTAAHSKTRVLSEDSVLSLARALANHFAGKKHDDFAQHDAQSMDFFGGIFCRAGKTVAEAVAQERAVEYAVVPLVPTEDADAYGMLVMSADAQSHCIEGLQVVATDEIADLAGGVAAAGMVAFNAKMSVDILANSDIAGEAAQYLRQAASILSNKFDALCYSISPEDLIASHEAGAEFFTLDIRSSKEWKAGHVREAYNIPLAELRERLEEEVPRLTPIVVISADACDAWSAGSYLRSLGAQHIYVLDGGMALWPFEREIA